MKQLRNILIVLTFTFLTLESYSQVRVHSKPDVAIADENPFLDGSVYTSFASNVGKGLYFPRTDLTSWTFKVTSITPGNFATYFDGMIVYNTGTGKTVADINKGGIQVDVTPGFYYFSNPTATFPGGSVATGKWMRMDSSSSVNTTTVAAGNGVSVTSTVSGNNTDYNVKVAHGKANEVLVTNAAGDAVEWTTAEKAFGIVKGTVKCTGVLQQTVNVNVKKGSVIMLTYSEPNSGAVISVAVGKVTTGTSFTILFGANPPTTASVHYIIL